MKEHRVILVDRRGSGYSFRPVACGRKRDHRALGRARGANRADGVEYHFLGSRLRRSVIEAQQTSQPLTSHDEP